MAAPLNVGVPLVVAALGNVIGCVNVIDADDDRTDEYLDERRGSTVYDVDHGHAVVPVPERGHAHEGDHVQGVDHVPCGSARA